MPTPEPESRQFNPTRPHIARVYDYLLGGKDNFAADRVVADDIIESLPAVHLGVRAQRAVLGRVVRYLVRDAGIRQLIDIGSGLPTADNVHQIAQRIVPATKVVYVDNDPVVLAHARALLVDNSSTIVVDGDLRRPAELMASPRLLAHLDWDQPIGLLLCGILHHLLDSERPADLVAELCRPLPGGSYLFIHHLVDTGDEAVAEVQATFKQALGRGQFRTQEQIQAMFAGFPLIEPGLVPVPEWRPDAGSPSLRDHPVLGLACAGVARKP